ncbi:unnamed protein product [Thelazia callipaeda]|uniref:Non-specific serine/threonine protein kinase n=1 Tax=Thelazia callipaeda TaxID=103827 RepID=A0A158RBQ2_THECL|nr:unnamed protein product [Thelazia callipaeda]
MVILNEKKNFNKDQRIGICKQLKETIVLAGDVSNIGCDWKKLIEDLLCCIKNIQHEVKSSVSECLGALGSIMSSQYSEFLRITLAEAKLIPDKFEDDKALILKSIFLSLTLIGSYSWQSHIKVQDIETLMTSIKNWLEINESPVVLISILDICLAVSKYFPAVFKLSFDDIVDFTVGWYTEPEQPNSVPDKCHEVLIELRPYWNSAIPAAVTLMKQFIDDASAYIEDIKISTSNPENTMAKIASILQALTTMFKVLSALEINPLVTDFVEKIFKLISQQVSYLDNVNVVKIGTAFEYVAEILRVALKIIPRSDLSIESFKTLRTMLTHSSVNEKSMLKILNHTAKIMENVTPEVIVEIMDYIVGDGDFLNLIVARSQEVIQAYSNVLGKLLTPKKLSTLQVVYSRIREHVLNLLNILKKIDTEECFTKTTVIENKLIVYFNALYSLGIIKNSLIAVSIMMGLSPSLFTFLITETPITEKWFIVNHPGCHYALLYIVKAHSEKHENFVANSSLLINQKSLALVSEPATAKHTSAILDVVTKLLNLDDFLWAETRVLLIDWIHSIFSLSSDVVQHIICKKEAIEMRMALLDSFVRHSLPKKIVLENKTAAGHRVRHFTLLRRLGVFNLIRNEIPETRAKFVRRIFEQCHLGSSDKIIGIWQTTPPALFINNGLTECAQDLMEFGQQSIPESSFTSGHFLVIADFLLNSSIPTFCSNNVDDGYWLTDTASIVYTSAMGDPNANTDCISKWRWIINQLAQFCIENRLRTPLGKPMDTFLAFENEIRRLASGALSRRNVITARSTKKEVSSKIVAFGNEKKGADDEDDIDGEVVRETRHLTNFEQWWRVRALLDTIEMLDKLIIYACYGSVFQLCSISQISQQFIVTNKDSCLHWLSRSYLPMMAVAYTNSYFAHVIRLGGCALKDIEKQISEKKETIHGKISGEIDSVGNTCVTWMVKAFIELSRPQAIMGLYAWIKKTYGKQCSWIKCAAKIASGQIESALDGLKKCLRDKTLSESEKRTVRQLFTSPKFKMFFRMKSLMTFENQSNSESAISVPWDIQNSLFELELKLMDIVHDRVNRDTKFEVTDLTRQLGEAAKMLMVADTNLIVHTRASALHMLTTAVKDSGKPSHKQQIVANMIDPSFLFELKGRSVVQHLGISQQLSTWLQSMQNKESNGPFSLGLIVDETEYYLGMAKLARKTKNYRLSEKCIKLHYNKRLPTLDNYQIINFRGIQGNWINGPTDKETSMFFSDNIQIPVQERLFSFENLTSTYGLSKMMWAKSETVENESCRTLIKGKAFSLLLNAVADEVDRLLYKNNLMFNGTPTVAPDALISVLSQINSLNSDELSPALKGLSHIANKQQKLINNEMPSKAIIQLARWLQMQPSVLSVIMNNSMRIASHIFGIEQSQLPLSAPSRIIDSFSGAFLRASCKLSPQLAKGHLELGNWAFEGASNTDNELKPSFVNEECDAIRWQIQNACPSLKYSVIESLLDIMQKCDNLLSISSDCKAIVGTAVDEQTCEMLFGPKGIVQEICKGVYGRHIAYCTCAIRSYFNYIAVNGKERKKGKIGVVIATLRIVQILVKHYDALSNLIHNEMLHTNELQWKDILPQLFARLSHPVHAVRDTLCTVLERIAASAPHALCYQAIVGATQPIVMHKQYTRNEGERNDFINIIDEDKEKLADEERCLMFECCQRIVAQMQKMFPDLVKNVTDFVKELQRIDMLHEERWIFVLTNLDIEINRRISQIEAEIRKTSANEYLTDCQKQDIIREKAILFTSLIYRIVEDLYDKTCKSIPLTTNEKQFQDMYVKIISDAMETSQSNRSVPREAWAPFKQLLTHLSKKSMNRSLTCLQMADISPRLTNFNKTYVPLPGQEHKNFDDVVMLELISKQTVILPTKTRPRKFGFRGSDGKNYPFLFKGQEDLHLDECIMQLLRICNLMLSAKETDWPAYTAEIYSVTPLGSRSGLIEWVEGATPIFQVFRKWQYRNASNNSNQKNCEIGRPSGLFFKKLRAAFQANDIPKDFISNRIKWPHSILQDVIRDLIKETPQDLLSRFPVLFHQKLCILRELWLRSGSSDTWFRVTERFARSTAVMSMLGSILGIGDRHLDNVLGRHLRVPEMVPFRLTGNMERALGPTEIEGTFRLSCANVLEKLRAGKEILLTVLDAFVSDPLIDWTTVEDDLGSRAVIAVPVIVAVYGTANLPSDISYSLARSLFVHRMTESCAKWLNNKNHMKFSIMSMIDVLENHTKKTQESAGYRLIHHERNVKRLELEKVSAEQSLKNSLTTNMAFKNYWEQYKESFSNPLVNALKMLDDQCNHALCISLFRSILDKISSIYGNLLLLSKMNEETESPLLCDRSTKMDQCKGQQEQSLQGKHVFKKVKLKLEGLDVTDIGKYEIGINDANKQKPLTPSEQDYFLLFQVDMLIQQATDISNLALMYEGWTAWV